ncbi:MAG: sigma-70 family RNA polymerase sigma factor [Gemmatimonadota bacterium]
MSIPDSAIVGRVLAGDVEAFASLVDRHHARCLKVATGVLGDSDDAEDAVQEAFVRAYRGLAGYRETERFGAWLLRIVVNQCRTHRARGARQDPRVSGAPVDFDALLEPTASAESGLDEAERREMLASALAQLGAEQREAVVLRFTDGLSYDEMATVTGVGVSALKMRVQRACTRLRTLLSEHLHA